MSDSGLCYYEVDRYKQFSVCTNAECTKIKNSKIYMMDHSTTRKVLKSHGLITSYYVCIPNHLPLKTNKTRTWELNFPTIWELWVARGVPTCYRVILGFYHILRARCLVCVLSCVLLFVISWTITARFLCLWSFPGSSTELITISYSRGSSWPRTPPPSLVSPRLAGGFFSTTPLGKPHKLVNCILIHTEVILALLK